uniref:Uncharacterized protein n=1 Tax=Romanomermis culicivorax TaxID=13658 RepID=A0A915JPR6_ROMCU
MSPLNNIVLIILFATIVSAQYTGYGKRRARTTTTTAKPSNECFLSGGRCIAEETFLTNTRGKNPLEIVDIGKLYHVYYQTALAKAKGDLFALYSKIKPEVDRLLGQTPHNIDTALEALRFLKPDANYCNIADIAQEHVLKGVQRGE